MQSERAQGTVEYVGVLLVAATLLVALAAALGVTGTLARSFTAAIEAAFGIGHGSAVPEASQAERDRFAAALDASVPADDRPSLGDLRLELIERHGDERGRAIYRALVVGEARRVVPGLAGTTRFGSLGPAAITRFVAGRSGSVEQLVALQEATRAPQGGDSGELETPAGPPDVHVVTVGEQDDALRAALHPGVDYKSLGEDVLGIVPVVGTAAHLGSLAMKGARLASAAATVMGATDDARQAVDAFSPGASEITPGLRAGDMLVAWEATRRNDDGQAVATVERTAVVRDGRLLAVGLTQRS